MSPTPQQSQDISIADIRSDLNGEVIGPDDAAYDEARQVIFKGIDRRPALDAALQHRLQGLVAGLAGVEAELASAGWPHAAG